MKAKTNIHCNRCQYLDITKRQVKLSKNNYRNTWIFFCKKLDLHIDTIEVKNTDLNSAGIPEIKAPWDCPKRQELRKQNKENHFETTIN